MAALTKLFILFSFAIALNGCNTTNEFKDNIMTDNKRTVTRYMAAFNETDHMAILSCLTEDVVWELPGVYLHKGKAEFDKEIENDAFTGKPVITVSRMTEQNDIVIAEGKVLATTKEGTVLTIVFCDVFEMEKGLIKKLTSYLMTTKTQKS